MSQERCAKYSVAVFVHGFIKTEMTKIDRSIVLRERVYVDIVITVLEAILMGTHATHVRKYSFCIRT